MFIGQLTNKIVALCTACCTIFIRIYFVVRYIIYIHYTCIACKWTNRSELINTKRSARNAWNLKCFGNQTKWNMLRFTVILIAIIIHNFLTLNKFSRLCAPEHLFWTFFQHFSSFFFSLFFFTLAKFLQKNL